MLNEDLINEAAKITIDLTILITELEERCPDCGGMESFCEEAGCESSSWTDADTRKYKDKCRLICKGVRDARNRNR